MTRTMGRLALFGLMAGGSVLLGHHSLAGVYQMDKATELSGTVADVKFTNPHGSLGVNVMGSDGTMKKWVMTLGSASALAQRGIGKTGQNALHVGDNIKIKFLPAKDGSPLGFLKTVTMPDGRVIEVSGNGPNE